MACIKEHDENIVEGSMVSLSFPDPEKAVCQTCGGPLNLKQVIGLYIGHTECYGTVCDLVVLDVPVTCPHCLTESKDYLLIHDPQALLTNLTV